MVSKEIPKNVTKYNQLQNQADALRVNVLDAVYNAGSGHIGGSFSAAEIFTALYLDMMRIDPADPDWDDRDRFVLGKGHAAPGLYAALAARGYFPLEELKTLRQLDSRLQGHPDMNKTPGVDITSGSLGQGLSIGLGMALAGKMAGKTYRTFVLLGDGEIQEGQVWEAAMAAPHLEARRLIAIVDYNKVQLDGPVCQVMEIAPLVDKWASFGWKVVETDGHDIQQLCIALQAAVELAERGPVVIVAHTVKGKGVSFMEHNALWHGSVPDEAEYESAKMELLTKQGGTK